jgi:hypothetical protein
VKQLFALGTAVVVLALTAFIGSAAAGSLVVTPPSGANPPADCVGPLVGATPNLSPWNSHFNGAAPDGTSAVVHDPACD